jgi:formylglycine-generating enzyme required for sulfatase activity
MKLGDFYWEMIAAAALVAVLPASAQTCTGDIVPDGRVDGIDLGVLLGYWGPRTTAAFSIASDLNQDGFIDGVDLGTLLATWGPCPSPPFNVPTWATLVEGLPDPGVVTDTALRQRIIDTGWAWRVRHTATQIEMLLVPPGTFQMGCAEGPACHQSQLPSHGVTLTSPFYLGRHEVTQSQWHAIMGSNPSLFQGEADSPSRPVESVTWTVVQSFLASTGMRLPSEAEWEFACRAGTSTALYNGLNDELAVGPLAWYAANAGARTHPVGLKQANALGLKDMIGNVWEFVSDWYEPNYFAMSPAVNPTGPLTGSARVHRGGSWYDPFNLYVRSSGRAWEPPTASYPNVGFRVARNP